VGCTGLHKKWVRVKKGGLALEWRINLALLIAMKEDTYTTKPPTHWQEKLSSREVCLFDELFPIARGPNKEVVVFVNDHGDQERFTIEKIRFLSAALAERITQVIKSPKSGQRRFFAVLGCSRESYILMATSSFMASSHCICFEDLSTEAIANRLKLYRPDVIFATGKTIEKVNSAVNLSRIEAEVMRIDSVVDALISTSSINSKPLIDPTAASYKPSDQLFTLFTSGSTGMPKGISHQPSRYAEFAAETSRHFFGLDSESTIFTATDAGWINGHTYAFYGPALCGSKTVICNALSKLSDPSYLHLVLSSTSTTCFYSSVTLLRTIKQSASKSSDAQDLGYHDLNRIGSCGEPLADHIGKWALEFFKPLRSSIVNTYFQTETGGVITAPRDEDGVPGDHASVGKPSCFIKVSMAHDVMSRDELEKEGIQSDELIICQPWQGIFDSIISDREVSYFTSKGYYRLHDVGRYDENGFLVIGGRSDDVINVAGHRVASSEIESIVISTPGIYEACAVEITDEIMGSGIGLLYSSDFPIDSSIIAEKISRELSQYHSPQLIYRFNSLPKTKSGKIMRRIIRDLLQLGTVDPRMDYSTLANKQEFMQEAAEFFSLWFEKNALAKIVSQFNLTLFESRILAGIGKHFMLSSLVVMLREIIGNELEQDEQVLDVTLAIVNDHGKLLSEKISGLGEKEIPAIHEEILKSEVRSESCLYEASKLAIVFSTNTCHAVLLLFEKINRSSNFNVFFQGRSVLHSSSVKSLSDALSPMCSTGMEEPHQASDEPTSPSKISMLHSSLSTQKEPSESVRKALRCHKCQASLRNLNEERGIDAYLMPIIRSDGEKAYLCDLCAAGW